MKQSRRQELKTNVLSVYLQQAYETIRAYSNHIIAGAVVVVLILVVAMVVQRNRLAALDQARRTYFELRRGSVAETPDLIDRAGALAAEQGLTSAVGARALELQGDLAYEAAMAPGLNDPVRKVSRLNQAKDAYEQLLAVLADQPETASRLQMSLAAVEESLFVAGQGDLESIRRRYQQVADSAQTAYGPIARDRLQTLNQRLERLRIVATRPAGAPATATAPGPRALSGPTTRPATGGPVALPAATQPALAPLAPAPGSAPGA